MTPVVVRALTGEMRHADAAPLAEWLATTLEQSDVTITTDELTRVDYGVVQVLLSGMVTAGHLDRSLHVDVSDDSTFAKAVSAIGLAEMFSGLRGEPLPVE